MWVIPLIGFWATFHINTLAATRNTMNSQSKRTIYSFPLSDAWFYDFPLFAVEKVIWLKTIWVQYCWIEKWVGKNFFFLENIGQPWENPRMTSDEQQSCCLIFINQHNIISQCSKWTVRSDWRRFDECNTSATWLEHYHWRGSSTGYSSGTWT